MHDKPNLFVFDLYGTLIQYGVRRNPLKKILQSAKKQGRELSHDDLRKLMTTNKPIDAVLEEMNIFLSSPNLHTLQSELDEEIGGLQLFDDVLPTHELIRDSGCKMAICSIWHFLMVLHWTDYFPTLNLSAA